MQHLPTVSIVIPCYNSEEFVAATVRSALEQSYAVEEIICVDDGSTDSTLDILRSIQKAGNNITIRSQENQGICGARNTGIEMSNAEYVAFLDHDDVLHPKKLGHQAKLLAASPFYPDFVAAAQQEVNLESGESRTREIYTEDPWIGLIHSRLGRTSSNLWRTSSVRKAGGWQKTDGLELDTGLMFRLLKNEGQVIVDPMPLTTRYVRSTTASMGNRGEWRISFFDIRAEIFQYLQSNNLLTQERSEALQIEMIHTVRILHNYDVDLAKRKNERIHCLFPSLTTEFGPGRLYRMLYKAFGFAFAEKIYPVWLYARKVMPK